MTGTIFSANFGGKWVSPPLDINNIGGWQMYTVSDMQKCQENGKVYLCPKSFRLTHNNFYQLQNCWWMLLRDKFYTIMVAKQC